MLRRKISLNKKGMALQVVIGIALALLATLVLLIIANNRIRQVDSFRKDCVSSGGVCVEVNKCGACNTYMSCKIMFQQDCTSEEDLNLICCPMSEVI